MNNSLDIIEFHKKIFIFEKMSRRKMQARNWIEAGINYSK